MRRLAYELLLGRRSLDGGVGGEVRITAVRGREILDSRGRPTVEAELELSDGKVVSASSRPARRPDATRQSRSGTAMRPASAAAAS